MDGLEKSNGFTLVELLVTLAIISLLTAIAVPEYKNYRNKEIRSDAVTSLTKLALEMERCKTRRGDGLYTACPVAAPANSGRGHYTLSIVLGNPATTYTISASKIGNATDKTADLECSVLFMTENGFRDAKTNNSSGLDTAAKRAARCWSS